MASVLVVDDEPDILLMLRVALEASGHEAVLAPDGEAGLSRLREVHVDLVLLDIMMPVMDGWEVLTELAANPEYSQKVILVSAKASDDAQLQGWELGADEYITKPFDLDSLLERVREVAARSEAESEKRRAEAIEELQNL